MVSKNSEHRTLTFESVAPSVWALGDSFLLVLFFELDFVSLFSSPESDFSSDSSFLSSLLSSDLSSFSSESSFFSSSELASSASGLSSFFSSASSPASFSAGSSSAGSSAASSFASWWSPWSPWSPWPCDELSGHRYQQLGGVMASAARSLDECQPPLVFGFILRRPRSSTSLHIRSLTKADPSSGHVLLRGRRCSRSASRRFVSARELCEPQRGRWNIAERTGGSVEQSDGSEASCLLSMASNAGATVRWENGWRELLSCSFAAAEVAVLPAVTSTRFHPSVLFGHFRIHYMRYCACPVLIMFQPDIFRHSVCAVSARYDPLYMASQGVTSHSSSRTSQRRSHTALTWCEHFIMEIRSRSQNTVFKQTSVLWDALPTDVCALMYRGNWTLGSRSISVYILHDAQGIWLTFSSRGILESGLLLLWPNLDWAWLHLMLPTLLRAEMVCECISQHFPAMQSPAEACDKFHYDATSILYSLQRRRSVSCQVTIYSASISQRSRAMLMKSIGPPSHPTRHCSFACQVSVSASQPAAHLPLSASQ